MQYSFQDMQDLTDKLIFLRQLRKITIKNKLSHAIYLET